MIVKIQRISRNTEASHMLSCFCLAKKVFSPSLLVHRKEVLGPISASQHSYGILSHTQSHIIMESIVSLRASLWLKSWCVTVIRFIELFYNTIFLIVWAIYLKHMWQLQFWFYFELFWVFPLSIHIRYTCIWKLLKYHKDNAMNVVN